MKNHSDNNQTDNYYIEKIKSGETRYFDMIMKRYCRKVFSLIAGIVKNREDAQDLTQDVFLKAFESLSSFREDSSFSTWLYSIAKNSAVSAMRKKINLVPIDETLSDRISYETYETMPSTEYREELIDCLRYAVEQLTPEERTLITLFYIDKKPVKEIAVSSALTVTNLKTKLFRIRKKISATFFNLNFKS
jgi:RNA polymerase sigma-70 factor (ECF subfamily)